MPPKISVIIPAHNSAAFIAAAVNSVQIQDFQDFEILIVDDASTDSSPAVVDSLAGMRIRVFHHPANLGAQAARNTGIRNACGEWIAFLDADDQYLPASLSARLSCARQTGRKVIYSNCLVRFPGGSTTPIDSSIGEGPIYQAIISRPGPTFPSLLVHAGCFQKIGLLDESLPAYQEWDTCIRLAREYQFGFVPDPTFIYNRSGHPTISSNLKKKALAYLQVVEKHRPEIVQVCGLPILARHYLRAGVVLLDAGDLAAGRACLKSSLRIAPFDPRALGVYLLSFAGLGPYRALRKLKKGGL